MPRAIALPLRERIVALRQQGIALLRIAQELGLSYRTVRHCYARFRKEGVAGLALHYQHCGRAGIAFAPALHQAAVALKGEHPRWGAGLIRLQLQEQFPTSALPSVRSLQRWFVAAGVQRVRSQRPDPCRQRAKQAHEVWQIDAKERLRLGDGSGTSLMNVTDEASGAVLAAVTFPPVPLGPGNSPGGAGGVAHPVCPLGAAPAYSRR